MEIKKLHRLIDEKKWTLIHHELELRISKRENSEDDEALIQIFESLDKEYRDLYATNLYLVMWKIAFKAGKVKLAKSYAESLLNYLIELKRIPALRKLILELSQEGLFRQHKKNQMVDTILGKKTHSLLEDFTCFEYHPEMWKSSKNILKSYLLEESNWNLESWKLVYEYVLKFYYDKDIFLNLAERAIKLNKPEHAEKILTFLRSKKVNLRAFEIKAPQETKTNDENLNVDYDQLAMDVISGVRDPSITEQKRILVSIQNLNNEELLEKGKDMIVAFGLLGMDKVVVRLCERVIPLINEVKQRAGIQFMLAQAYYNGDEFHKACDLIDDTFESEPLLPDEVLAFNYLKAECLLKLRKNKKAKELFILIKKYNPQYRLVGERLRELAEIK